jgi:serine/threonine protein kinase
MLHHLHLSKKIPSTTTDSSSLLPPIEEPEYSAELPTQSLQAPIQQALPHRRPPPSSLGDYANNFQPSFLDPRQQQLQQQQLQQQETKQQQVYEQQQRKVEEQRLLQEHQYAEEKRQMLAEERIRAQRLEQEEDDLRQHQAYNDQQFYLQQQSAQQNFHEDSHLAQQDISFQQDYDEESTSHISEQGGQALESSKHLEHHIFVHDEVLQKNDEVLEKKKSGSLTAVASHHSHKRHRAKVGLDDFNFIAVLGRGNFGKVMLGRSHRTNQLCAVKILKKDMIIDNSEIQSMQAEKDVFLIANREQHPFLTNLHCSFQTANRIYFVMEYVSGGDLMWHVQQGNFSLRRAKFYAAEVLLALKYLHENGIVYRDLKLDNIMLSTEGHIKLADYGLCKPDMWYGKTTNTFCGTPEFMAPEILKEQNYTRSVDWWAFGVLVYQMLLGKSPFRGDDEDEVFNAILTDEPLFPIQMASEAVGLLQSLLEKNPQARLGSGPRDAEEIMEHPYFGNINFDNILDLKVPPPYIPEVKTEEDVSFFDKDFTTEVPRLTPVNSVLDSATQAQFRGFSYVNELSGL